MGISLHTKQIQNILVFLSVMGVLCFSVPTSTFAITTETPQVNLNFNVPIYINNIRLSNYPTFQDALVVPYTTGVPVAWDICHGRPTCNSGTYYVYADFLIDSTSIRVGSNVVTYRKQTAPVDTNDNEPQEEPVVPDVPDTDLISDPVVEDVPPTVPEIPIIETPPIIPEIPIVEKPPVVITPTMSPLVETTVQTVEVAGLATAVVATVAPVVSTASNISELIMIILRAWNAIMVFFGLRRRTKPWGVVYDSTTKQPLDPAYVTLLDTEGKEVATSITDINGRYGFLVPAGTYRMSAGKTQYVFPSKNMAGRTSDALYDDLYLGQEITITEGGVITKNIPMDTEHPDWNQEEKKRMGVGRVSGVSVVFGRIITIAFYIGFAVTVIMTLRDLSTFNIILCAFYVLMTILRALGVRPRSYGVLTVQTTNESLGHAVIKVFSKGLNREVAHAVSDLDGHYYSLVPKGEYYVKIQKKVADEQYEEVFTSESIKTDKGIINKSFHI